MLQNEKDSTAIQHAENFIEEAIVGLNVHDYEIVLDGFDEYLAHYGVKGMKWGVRKDRSGNSGRRISSKTSAKISKSMTKRKAKAAKGSRSATNKNRRELSDAELTAMIGRLEKEKKLKTLLDNDVAPGRTFVRTVMTDAGKQALTTVAKGTMIYGVSAALTKNFSAKELGRVIVKGKA